MAFGRQVGERAVWIKAPVGPHILVFDDQLALALRLCPRAGHGGASPGQQGHRDQKTARELQTS